MSGAMPPWPGRTCNTLRWLSISLTWKYRNSSQRRAVAYNLARIVPGFRLRLGSRMRVISSALKMPGSVGRRLGPAISSSNHFCFRIVA